MSGREQGPCAGPEVTARGGGATGRSPGQTLPPASSSPSVRRCDEGEGRSTGKGRGPGVGLQGAQELRAAWGLRQRNRGGGRRGQRTGGRKSGRSRRWSGRSSSPRPAPLLPPSYADLAVAGEETCRALLPWTGARPTLGKEGAASELGVQLPAAAPQRQAGPGPGR